jgi:AraC family transcriptional regulator of adaptative response / DNA-3-methyladenine glycosylase II
MAGMQLSRVADTDRCYRAVQSRDRRFDGVFYTAVRTTGIYCRPSCPAMTPRRPNVEFYVSAAAAQLAGYRACRRCLPDATPGSPDWDVRADAAGRAVRLINDGVVERDGVPGLARRIGYTPRHLSRLLSDEVGAGPLALARARRAQTARTLLETTGLSMADIAFASGFSSVRQFNATMAEVYACTPTALRSRRHRGGIPSPGRLRTRLAVRRPFDGPQLLRFLEARAVPGIELVTDGTYSRTLTLPHGPAVVHLTPGHDAVACDLEAADLRDVGAAVERCRRLLDLDADPAAVGDVLGADPVLGATARSRPGLRVPGHVDGLEVAVRAVVGQQISVAGARTVLTRLVAAHGTPLAADAGPRPDGLSHTFPDAATLAGLDPESLPMPRSRGRALVGLCAAIAAGDIPLDRSMARTEVRRRLLELRGVGPWTADYILLRSLGDPDVFLPTDVGVRHGLAALGADPSAAEALSQAWRPWRSYALMHLWASVPPTRTAQTRPRRTV